VSKLYVIQLRTRFSTKYVYWRMVSGYLRTL